MLQSSSKVAIYMEGHLFTENGKMGYGALRYLPNPIVAVIDSERFRDVLNPLLRLLLLG